MHWWMMTLVFLVGFFLTAHMFNPALTVLSINVMWMMDSLVGLVNFVIVIKFVFVVTGEARKW